jgi:hypothetical protein
LRVGSTRSVASSSASIELDDIGAMTDAVDDRRGR